VVIGVFEVGLDQVVVDVLGREFRLDAGQAQGFKGEHNHGAGGVLGEGLVNADANFAAGDHLAFQQVRGD
jgi:hypothetical protein